MIVNCNKGKHISNLVYRIWFFSFLGVELPNLGDFANSATGRPQYKVITRILKQEIDTDVLSCK